MQHAGGVDPLHPLGVQPERERGMPGVGTDDGRMFGGARVAELERLGPQHHGGQPPLGRPLASGGIGGRLALGPLDGQAGLIDHRHQHHELGVVGAAVCSGWPTEATPSSWC